MTGFVSETVHGMVEAVGRIGRAAGGDTDGPQEPTLRGNDHRAEQISVPFFGGANNLLDRVTGDEDDLAVTFIVMPTTA